MTTIYRDVNQLLAKTLDEDLVSVWLLIGRNAAQGWPESGRVRREQLPVIAAIRARHGFKAVPAPLLTHPDGQHKLGLAKIPSFGLTLHSFRFTDSVGYSWNLCASAGQCTRVCVIKNGNGMYPAVQRGWSWKTELLLHEPRAFFIQLGYELQRQVMKHGDILVRPNVNSDIMWERVAPTLVDGSVFKHGAVYFYGYTKHDYVLYDTPSYRGDGQLTPYYRVAFSHNEWVGFESHAAVLDGFLRRGGNVAVVTDRYYTGKTKQQVGQWYDRPIVVDADVSDEWMLAERGVIGDLAFKPRTSRDREWGYSDRSGFVHKVYGTASKMENRRGKSTMAATIRFIDKP
jgi:hypothetical protein